MKLGTQVPVYPVLSYVREVGTVPTIMKLLCLVFCFYPVLVTLCSVIPCFFVYRPHSSNQLSSEMAAKRRSGRVTKQDVKYFKEDSTDEEDEEVSQIC